MSILPYRIKNMIPSPQCYPDVNTSIFWSNAVHVLEVLTAGLHMQVDGIRSHWKHNQVTDSQCPVNLLLCDININWWHKMPDNFVTDRTQLRHTPNWKRELWHVPNRTKQTEEGEGTRLGPPRLWVQIQVRVVTSATLRASLSSTLSPNSATFGHATDGALPVTAHLQA